jgi:glucosamine--fructose-6-phosphate aminotransferase (isomerizing)
MAEIAGQPGAVRRAARGLGEQRAVLERLAAIPAGTTLVFTGMGSSYDACYPAVTELAASGVASLHLGAAELLHFRTGVLGAPSLVVAVSQSGESAEMVRLARLIGEIPAGERPAVLAVTNGPNNELASLSDMTIDTRAGAETGPSTMTFAAALVALSAIGSILAGTPIEAALARTEGEGELAAAAIERLLADQSLAEELATRLGPRAVTVVLGRGPARAAAEMGALTLKEAVGLAVESLETAQFRHGPLELAGSDLAAIVIATEQETLELDVALADELAKDGSAVLVIARGSSGPPDALRIDVGSADRTILPAVSIVPIQLLAWRLAVMSGREPGAYVRASKVTTHE